MGIRYRPEVDGLRTIAVLSVIIYHATFEIGGATFMPGGFLGVDIFFVISGFLITSLILVELEGTGRFSLRSFYERRIRRLLPVLLVVMLVSMVAAWQILLPTPMVDFAKSLLASLFFVSNFYWDVSLQVYGAESSLLQPFLHTWSLAVEEQYYILFPLVLAAGYRWVRGALVWVLIACFLLSLSFAQWFTGVDAHSSFYLLPSRLWELLLGGLLASMAHRRPRSGSLLTGLALAVALGVLMASFFLIDHDSHHPGMVTLVPTLATAVILWLSGGTDPVSRLLSSRLFVSIGLISYSLYLWHYPLFAFARLSSDESTTADKLAWIGLTFVLSILSYRLVEKPFRNRAKIATPTLLAWVLAGVVVVTGWSIYVVKRDGVKERLHDLVALYGINEFDQGILRAQAWEPINMLARARGYGESEPQDASEFEAEVLWFTPGDEATRVLVVGNSVSRDMFNALYLNAARFPGYQFARYGMHPAKIDQQRERLFASPNFQHADVILFNFMIRDKSPESFERLVREIARRGKNIVITSGAAAFWRVDKHHLFDWFVRKHGGIEGREEAFNRFLYTRRMPGLTANARIRELAAELDIPYLEIWDLVCDAQDKICWGVTPAGYRTRFDDIHWSLEGARFYGERAARLHWLQLD